MYQETAFDGREPLPSLSSCSSDDSLSGAGIDRTPFFRNHWTSTKFDRQNYFSRFGPKLLGDRFLVSLSKTRKKVV